MGMLKFFDFRKDDEKEKLSKLYSELETEYPDVDEEKLVIMSCIAGLMARIAYVDFELDDGELAKMTQVLENWELVKGIDPKKVSKMAVDHILEMAGLENHLFVYPLKSRLSKEDRISVIRVLFVIAASDGVVEASECEDIRLVCKGLELSNDHYIAARAEVAQYLKAL